MDQDKKYIEISHFLLKKILGTTFPNPPVVSLIVESDKNFKRNKIISFGFTNRGGRPHAEEMALKNVIFNRNNSYTLYSTLEPCCHFGRSESCVSKILKTKINRVVYSLRDPDKRVNGSGESLLKKNGIEVLGGVMNEQAKKFYKGYILNRKLCRPKVTLKIGCSLDGKIAFKPNQRDKITNNIVNKIVHIYRSEFDAILVGSDTIKIDNPKLNCRIKGLENNSPLRVVLSKSLNLNLNSEVFKNCRKLPTIIFTTKFNTEKIKKLSKKNVNVFSLERNKFKLSNILLKLAEIGICNILVEGGAKVFTSFINENLTDSIMIFRSSFFIGSEGKDLIHYSHKEVKNMFALKEVFPVEDNTLEILENKNTI